MLPVKVIFFEGLPGAGKSILAQWLEGILLRQGIAARWYFEADAAHPLNWFEDWLLPPDTPFDLLPYLHNIAASMARSLERWRQFAAQAGQSEAVILLEGWPFLNSVGLFSMSTIAPAALLDYGRQVQQLMGPVASALIRFEQPDVRAALRRVLALRGEGFQQELFANMGRFPFCSGQGLSGFDCVAALWDRHQTIIRQLCADFTPHARTIDITQDGWQAVRGQVLDSLGLTADDSQADCLDACAGVYGNAERMVVIRRVEDSLLYEEREQRIPLVWSQNRRFYWRGLPVILRFGGDSLLIDHTRLAGEVHHLARLPVLNA